MKRTVRRLGLLAGLAGVAVLSGQPPPTVPPEDLLRVWLAAAGTRQVHAGGETLASPADVLCFYDRRKFQLAWSDAGRPRPEAVELLVAVAKAEADGLRPADYHLAALRRAIAPVTAPVAAPDSAPAPATNPVETPSPAQTLRTLQVPEVIETDLLLTDAFLTFGAHLRSGRVNPQKVYNDCAQTPPKGDLTTALDAALLSGRIGAALDDLAPPHPGYRGLRAALSHLREVAARGGWARVPPGPTLKPGDRGPRVAALKARLAEQAPDLALSTQSGLAAMSAPVAPAAPAAPIPPAGPILPAGPGAAEPAELDAALSAALRRFQQHHGLELDGKVGKGTLRVLNVSAQERVRQIESNLERWRWLPRDLGDPHLEVNIAGFGLKVVEGGKTALEMRVIVGKAGTRSPLFSSLLNQVVLNPYWNVPVSILHKEIAKKVLSDPGYFEREELEVQSRTGARLSPSQVDWSHPTGIAVRQRPGNKNALGQIKFLFPSRFDVYLHDTPSRGLFSKTVRTFSHGCIRIEKPFELATYLLAGDPAWTPEKIAAGIAEGHERVIRLARPVPVHVVYWTAWVDDAGELQLRDDIYRRDERLLGVLR